VLLQKCLEHFNFVSESVINAILEDTLPADLRSIDQTLPRIPSDTLVLSVVTCLFIYFIYLCFVMDSHHDLWSNCYPENIK
jgi:hypothetical protein